MKTSTAYMSLKEGRELEEIFLFMNHLSDAMNGAKFLLPGLDDLYETIKNNPDQFGNYRIVKVTLEMIDD